MVKHRQQVVADAIEQAIRDAFPIGYTGRMVVKVSITRRSGPTRSTTATPSCWVASAQLGMASDQSGVDLNPQ